VVNDGNSGNNYSYTYVTDTTGVIPWMKTEYDHGYDQARPAGVSVRALEHADVTRLLSEYRYRGFNEDTEYWVAKELAENSTGIISYVSDSENYFRMIRDYALRLKPVILARKDREDGQPARFVFRPDSSRKTPLEVICGYDVVKVENLDEIQPKNWASDTAFQLPDGKYFTHTGKKWEEISHDEVRGSLDIMWEVWGGTEWNNFKIINPKVGLIYGEAISVEMQQEIYETMERKGFSAFNILMGKGSYASLKNNTRDMFSITYKQTFSTADLIDLGETGVELVQQKSPMGADYKKSAAGRLRVDNEKGELVLVQNQTKEQAEGGLLEVLVDNGVIITNGNSFMDAVNTHSVYFKAMEDDIINEESVLEFLSANIGK
jgi:nicotinamide phosphoribosyltransferase